MAIYTTMPVIKGPRGGTPTSGRRRGSLVGRASTTPRRLPPDDLNRDM
ncbi:MAG: hypothetical protein J2P17_02000 [Mycobacterium sp.]|nr:hypothetical protein [Mycobacterium sp.]